MLRLIKSKRVVRSAALCARSCSNASKPAPAGNESAIVLTPYQKVAEASRASAMIGAIALGSVCGYFIVKELLPTRMNPNSLFGEAMEKAIQHPDVADALGEPIKGYGRDRNVRKEGRRNFIEHVSLKDKNGVPRMRIKFNLEGSNGHAFCFAEVKKGMASGEYVYLIVQSTSTGQVITIQDNRQILDAESEGEKDALQQLLSGGK